MSNFDVEQEIDVTIDKIAEQLKARLKKMVERSEKNMLKQYIASQKETTRKETTRKDSKSSSTKAPAYSSGRGSESKLAPVKRVSRRKEYSYSSESEESD